MKIVTVVGARPQFVKSAVISRVIRSKERNPVKEIIVHTGQHYDHNMSKVFFEQMNIPSPAYSLNINGGTHGRMTGRMLEKMDHVLEDVAPDIVMVFGDTNSTLAGALSAVKMNIPVAHVEAGLRSGNMRMPEEINRILADQMSTWLFCPTKAAESNLIREGIESERIFNVGDVMLDAVRYYTNNLKPSDNAEDIVKGYPDGYCLSTIHRAGTTDSPLLLAEILEAMRVISRRMPIVLPLHPRTRKVIDGAALSLEGIRVEEPLSYFDMLYLLKNCRYVLTDSGGLQKEAFFFEKPCLTLRDETEWVELIDLGVNVLGGVKKSSILEAWEKLSTMHCDFSAAPYGDGAAGEKILDHLIRN